MAIILRRERTDPALGRKRFVSRNSLAMLELVFTMPNKGWEQLGKPEALAITYEAYEEPTRAE